MVLKPDDNYQNRCAYNDGAFNVDTDNDHVTEDDDTSEDV